MNPNHLKELLRHIILEVSSQYPLSEMIANKDYPPDVMGAVNVEEGIFGMGDGDVKKKARELFGKVKKINKISHPGSNSEYFRIILADPDSEHTIRKDKSGNLSLVRSEEGGQLKFDPVEEETGSGAVAGYSTPFAFKSTGGAGERKKKKKKHVKESRFLGKVQQKLQGNGLTTEKILPDGRYADDMEDGGRSNRIAGLKEAGTGEVDMNMVKSIMSTTLNHFKNDRIKAIEFLNNMANNAENQFADEYKTAAFYLKKNRFDLSEETSSGAVFSGGPTIQVPAWGTKNKLGSPKAIKGSEKLGYKVVRSITNEGSKI